MAGAVPAAACRMRRQSARGDQHARDATGTLEPVILPGMTCELHAQVRNVKGEWRQIAMSRDIKALVVLNLQSYAGGRDLWGLRDPKRDAAKGWQTPIFNDGFIEVR